ncbi:MAG: YCF48-related protein [Cytophagaceae bacterium]|jgi:photosystem II stability/assembly factor-like uncharacterized protein|nr:YCF48-related protein [Cytophagaceae bacterium]
MRSFYVAICLFLFASCSEIICEEKETKNKDVSFFKIEASVKENLKSVSFVSEDTGYVCGNNGVILKTTDGGKTWNSLQSNTTNNLHRIKFTSSKIGYVVGNNRTLLKTTNAGQTWVSLMPIIPGEHFRSIQFFDDNNGIVAGFNSSVYFTTNGGGTWTQKIFPTNFNNRVIYSMYFTDMNNGYMGCSWGDFVYYNGTTFTQINLGLSTASSSAIWDIQPVEDRLMLLHNQYSTNTRNIFSSNDWYNSFSILNSSTTDTLIPYSMDFISKMNGWMVGGRTNKSYGSVYSTTDGGYQWIRDTTINSYYLFDITHINDKIIMVGDSGNIIMNK